VLLNADWITAHSFLLASNTIHNLPPLSDIATSLWFFNLHNKVINEFVTRFSWLPGLAYGLWLTCRAHTITSIQRELALSTNFVDQCHDLI
jgi:hypothetical protein